MVQECKCFYPKSLKQFPIKMQHKDQKPGARCTNFSSKFEFPPKNGAQSIKVEFAPAADVWWLLWCWSTCKPVPMNIFAARRPTYPTIHHWVTFSTKEEWEATRFKSYRNYGGKEEWKDTRFNSYRNPRRPFGSVISLLQSLWNSQKDKSWKIYDFLKNTVWLRLLIVITYHNN